MSLRRQRGLVPLAFFVLACRSASPSLEPVTSQRVPAQEAVYDRIVEVAAGPESTCARSRRGRVACLGRGMAYDEENPFVDTHVPQVIPVPPSRGISAGQGFACSVDRDGGTVRCWGDNREGQLGRATPGPFDHWPREVPGVEGVVQLVSHGDRTCALASEDLWCWPEGDENAVVRHPLEGREPSRALFDLAKLGDRLVYRDTLGSRWTKHVQRPWRGYLDHGCAFQVEETLPAEAREQDAEEDLFDSDPGCEGGISVRPGMEVGLTHACSLEDGRLQCRGPDLVGETSKPGTAFTTPVVDFALGSEHTCAVSVDGELRCWGAGMRGQIGLVPAFAHAPERVAEGVDAVWVARGATCMKRRDGTFACTRMSEDPCAEPEFTTLVGPSGVAQLFDAHGTRGCIVDTTGSLWCARDEAWVEHLPAAMLPAAETRTAFAARGHDLCWIADGRPTCAGWETPADAHRYEQRLALRREHPLHEGREDPSERRERLVDPHQPFEGLADAVELQWFDKLLCVRSRDGRVQCVERISPLFGDPRGHTWASAKLPPTRVRAFVRGGWVREDGTTEDIWGLFSHNPGDDGPHKMRTSPREEDDTWASDVDARASATGPDHACAIDAKNDLWCWGDATGGRLGGGDPICSRHPRSLTAAFHQAWEDAR